VTDQGNDSMSGFGDGNDEPWAPGFREAAAVQAVCDAMEVSAAQRRWVAVSEIAG
jgi:hypothetical protein